jgi:hypothetical protein
MDVFNKRFETKIYGGSQLFFVYGETFAIMRRWHRPLVPIMRLSPTPS